MRAVPDHYTKGLIEYISNNSSSSTIVGQEKALKSIATITPLGSKIDYSYQLQKSTVYSSKDRLNRCRRFKDATEHDDQEVVGPGRYERREGDISEKLRRHNETHQQRSKTAYRGYGTSKRTTSSRCVSIPHLHMHDLILAAHKL